MIEVQIICSNPCLIPDLGLDLKRGEERWISLDNARRSKDLETERAKGNVRVSRQSRRPEKAPPLPPPPFVALTQRTRPKPVEAAKPPEDPITPSEAPKLDTSAIADEVQEKVMAQLRPLLEALAPSAPMDATQMAQLFESVVRKVMPAGAPGVAASASTRPSAEPEAPLYLPTNLVDKDAKAKIDVATTSSNNEEEIDEAAAALRAMKRRKEDG